MSVAKPRGVTGMQFEVDIKTPPDSETSKTWKKIFPDSEGADRATTLTNRKYNRNVDYSDQQAQIWNSKWKRPGGGATIGNIGQDAGIDPGK